MFDKDTDSGVSPVIGVILMVAVTVALVALVTVVVFDLGGDVSDSPDATVQLEEDGGSVTATVLRNENVEDFTLQGQTVSGSTETVNLAGDAGSTNTISDVTTTSQFTETFSSDDGTDSGDNSAPIAQDESVTVSNTDVESINQVVYDADDDGNYDDVGGGDTDVTSDFIIEDAVTGEIQYTGSSDLTDASADGIIEVDYDQATGTDALDSVNVIANMPDGNSEVLTSTEVNN